MKGAILSLVCSLAAGAVLAQSGTVYIRDELYVPLRSGQTQQHRIVHKGLVSGTPLTLIERNEESGYSRVKTQDGTEGWIQTQYLSDTPVAKDLLDRAQSEVAQLKQRVSELQQQLQTTRSENSDYSGQLEQLQTQNARLQNELARIKEVSGNALGLDRENKALLKTVEELKHQVDVYASENTRLREDHENEAFLNGAFAVVIGVLITLLVPRLMPKRKSEWK